MAFRKINLFLAAGCLWFMISNLNGFAQQTHTEMTLEDPQAAIGPKTFSNWNSWFVVDGSKYSGCPAAVTAAGTVNKAIVMIPSTGPLIDCPTGAISPNITILNFDGTRDWCGPAAGNTGTCNAVNYNYTDGNVYAVERHEMTTNSVAAAGANLGLYTISTLSGATAVGVASGVDGFSGEANSTGVLSGTFGFLNAHEADSTIGSTGGTFTTVRNVSGYTNTKAGSTTAVGTVEGVWGGGCNSILGSVPTNCYGLYGKDQLSQASGRNYSLGLEGMGLLMWSANLGKGGLDCEDKAHATHNCFYADNSTNGTLNIQAVSTDGMNFNTSDGAARVTYSTSGFSVATIPLQFTSSLKASNTLISVTAPTISSGFGTSPSIPNSNSTAAFTLNVGTGGTATNGVIGLPTAVTGWHCMADDLTTQSATVFYTHQIATTTTTATIANFNTAGAQAAWVASDVLRVSCFAY